MAAWCFSTGWVGLNPDNKAEMKLRKLFRSVWEGWRSPKATALCCGLSWEPSHDWKNSAVLTGVITAATPTGCFSTRILLSFAAAGMTSP